MTASASASTVSEYGSPETRKTTNWVRFPAELALLGVTLATIYQLDPLFVDNSYFGPLALIAVVLHLVLALTRRARSGAAIGIVAALVVLPVMMGLIFYPESTFFGLPTGTTFSAARADVLAGWLNVQTAVPPTEVNSAYLVAVSLTIWMVVLLSDWAAFRFWSPGEALLPSLSALVFLAILDRVGINMRGVFAYLVAALVFLLLHRVVERVSSGTWLGHDIGRSFAQLVTAGAMISVVAALLVYALAPSVPGYEEPPIKPLFEPQGEREDQDRTVANPLVDIKDRIQRDPELEVFTVRSDRPTYWRTTALGLFDGGQFRARATYKHVESDLSQGFPLGIPESDQVTSTQQFAISALSQEWLPAAYQPFRIDAGDVEVQFEPDSATLITAGNQVLSNGLQYVVESHIPVFTPANLTAGTSNDSVDSVYAELPTDFDPAVTELAQQITADASTTYAKAIALQDYFQRTGNFTYSLEPVAGHSVANISEFLERKSGYCEQFSVTYAAMARAIGIPSRVAVGFTQGEQDPIDPTLFHVRNKHAHAWPEVYIGGVGWVPFEPTPGRGMQGAEQYTMLPADQQDGQPAPTPTPIEQPVQPEVVPPEQAESQLPTPTPLIDEQIPETPEVKSEQTASLANTVWDLFVRNLRFFVIVGTALALALLALIAIRQLKSQRYVLRRDEAGLRLHHVTDPAERIAHAWRVATDAIAFDGPAPQSAETNVEYIKRAAAISPVVSHNEATLRKLGTAVTASRFSSRPVGDADVALAEGWSEELVAASFSDRSRLDRWAWTLDPRPLVETWRRRPIDKVPAISEAPGAPAVSSVHTSIVPPPPSGAVPRSKAPAPVVTERQDRQTDQPSPTPSG